MPPRRASPTNVRSGKQRQAAIHGSVDTTREELPAGFTGQLVSFCEELRGEGMAVGTSELLDATAALGQVGWGEREVFREALAATLTKSGRDRDIFDQVFDRFFFRAVEAEALRRKLTDAEVSSEIEASQKGTLDPETASFENLANGSFDQETAEAAFGALREAIAEAVENGASGSVMGDLARLAIAAVSSRIEQSGVVGVDLQRIKRALDLQNIARGVKEAGAPLPREDLRRFEEQLRIELERMRAERVGELPNARPLSQLARGLSGADATDLADVQRIIRQLRRRLKTQGNEMRGRRRRVRVDIRATMRESMQTGGVPLVIRERPVRPHKPELFVLCDVSTSVSSSSVFFLAVLHALNESFAKMRSFVFVERIAEVTDLLAKERDIDKLAKEITNTAGIADVSGYTDYGRVWAELLENIEHELHPRATLIVLGDARTNGRDPAEAAFMGLTEKAGRTIWLNPEPELYWDYGDSVISRYAKHCEVYECWTSDQLEQFVLSLTQAAPRPGAHSPAPKQPARAGLPT